MTINFPGFSTPGPYLFRPESERGPKHVLGLQLKTEIDETLGPGMYQEGLDGANSILIAK